MPLKHLVPERTVRTGVTTSDACSFRWTNRWWISREFHVVPLILREKSTPPYVSCQGVGLQVRNIDTRSKMPSAMGRTVVTKEDIERRLGGPRAAVDASRDREVAAGRDRGSRLCLLGDFSCRPIPNVMEELVSTDPWPWLFTRSSYRCLRQSLRKSKCGFRKFWPAYSRNSDPFCTA